MKTCLLTFLAFAALIGSAAFAAPATPLTSFDGDGRASTDLGDTDNAAALITQPDGKVLLLVNRSDAQRTSVLRYTVAGALDTTWSGDGRVDLSVPSSSIDALTGITLQNDGKVVVTGDSVFADGSRRVVVARFLSDGTLDPSFDTDGVAVVNAANAEYGLTGGNAVAFGRDVAVQTDGKIVVAGQMTRNTGGKFNGLVLRLDAAGSLDTDFAGNGVAGVEATATESTSFSGLEIQPDGKIVAAGNRFVGGSDFQCVVARLTAAGGLDTAFDTDGLAIFDANLADGGAFNGWDLVRDVKLAPDGGILLAIDADVASFSARIFLARLSRSNGALDSSFGGDGVVNTSVAGGASKIDVQGDGRILISGGNSSFNIAVLRRNANGTADTTWDTDGLWTSTATSSSNGLHVGPDGRVYASALDNAFIGGSAHVWALEGNAVVSQTTLSPADNATGVGAADNLVITFPSAVTVNSGSIQIVAADTFAALESIPVGDGRITGGGTNTITINPTSALAGGTKYYLVVPHDAFRAGSTPVRGLFNTDWEFTTGAAASLPTVTTATQSGVTHNSATLGGNVTADGGASVTERGIVWGTSADPTTSNNKVQIGSSTGVFSQLVTGLPSSTTVHVRAYAINTAGTAYGDNISFTTSAPPPSADLVLTITDSPDPVYAGSALAYTLTVTNNGPSTATNVQVSTTLPAGVSLVSTSGAVQDPIGVPVATLGSIASGNFTQFTINVFVAFTTVGPITLNATASSAVSDPVSGNNSDNETTTVLENNVIGDFVWNDLNGDGIQDGGEPGLSGLTVFVDLNTNGSLDGGEPSDTTDGSGNYVIPHLPAGIYQVKVDEASIPVGFVATTSNPRLVTLAGGIPNANVDFGLAIPETRSLVVTTTADTVNAFDGQTSLREAIAYANSGSAGASPVITFASPLFDTAQTIALAGGEILITAPLTVAGPGADKLTVNAGGASGILRMNNAGAVHVLGLTLANGNRFGTGGGAIYSQRSALVVRNCAFVQNTTSSMGGAIFNYALAGAATTDVTGCLFFQNTAPTGSGGGAIASQGGGGVGGGTATTRITNCTFSENTAPGTGGAIYSWNSSGAADTTVTHCTFSANTAASGTDIAVYGGATTVSVGNCILGSGAAWGASNGATLNSLGYNITAGTDGPNNGSTDQLNTNPLLGALADNGGPTQTHALLSGSPAIDAGNPAFDPNAFTPPLTTDQRGSGFDRVVQGGSGPSARIDIGAFEVQTTPAPDIAVFDGTLAGTELMDDTGTVDFGSVERFAASAARVFTIQNTGTAVLSGIAVTKGAAGQPGEFALDTTGMSTSLLAGESTTFTVTLTPGAFGPRGAVLEIASNDDDENPFEIHLAGAGAPPEFAVVTGRFMLPAEGLVGGGQIYRPLGGVINQDGFVTIAAQGAVGTGGITSGSDNLLLSDASGSLRVVAREGSLVQTSPWQTLAGAFSHFLLTKDGQTVALDRIAGAASTSDYAYLVSPDGVALEILSREGDAAPSAGTFKLHTAKPAADTQGRVYFSGDLTGAGVSTKNDSGIYQASAGSVVEIAREGDDVSALTGDAAWLGGMGAMVAAAGDGAAFTATLQNNPADSKDKTDLARNAVVLAGNESGLELLARKGDVVPETGGAKMRTFSGVSRGGADSHAFLGLMSTGGGVTTANDQVLVALTSTGSHLVARKGVTQADGVTLVKFGDFYATSADEVVFEASGVLCRWTEGGGLEALMRVGAAAPGMGGATITNLAKLSVSEGGAIALVTNLSDGRRALWRALPGAALSPVVVSGETILVNGVPETIFTLDMDGGGAGTGGGGGGMGAAINDDGFVYATLSLGNGMHLGKVFP